MSEVTEDRARALGERWLAAGGGWGPGMLAGGYVRQRGQAAYSEGLRLAGVPHPDLLDMSRAWPDLRDPATRGAALAVVRERLRDPGAYVRPDGLEWKVDGTAWHVGRGATEAETLVAALEAAPKAGS